MSSVEYKDNSKAILDDMEKSLLQAATMIGGTIEGHAKELAPKDTGLLTNSITYAIGGETPHTTTYRSDDRGKEGNPIEVVEGHYEGSAPPDSKDQVTVYVGTNVKYAPYQELGAPSIGLPARAFLRPAFENFKSEIEQIVKKCLGR